MEHLACPCLHTKPCDPRCTCLQPLSSVGCRRCCSYGSKAQQKKAAESLAQRIDSRLVRVGVAAIIGRTCMSAQTGKRERQILMGRRKGSHGAGTWSFPGGHQEWGETIFATAVRESMEEAGLKFPYGESHFSPLTFTNDIFQVENKHYITLYCACEWTPEMGEPHIMEPDKCEEWRWTTEPPSPLFLPVENMLRSGFYPWRLQEGGTWR
jgi:8-oxo-dGTP diphosphatase